MRGLGWADNHNSGKVSVLTLVCLIGVDPTATPIRVFAVQFAGYDYLPVCIECDIQPGLGFAEARLGEAVRQIPRADS